MEIQNVLISDILAEESFNCRGRITPGDVIELRADIEKHGLLQPVIGTPLPEGHVSGQKLRLIAGYRRLFTCKTLGHKTISMVVREKMSDADAIVINLNENLQRENLDIVQEAMAISRLRDLGLSEEMAAQELSKSRGWVQIRFMLLGLPSEIYPEVKAGFINQTNIRELFSIHRKEGKEATLQAAHGVKDKKQRGVKSSIAKSEGEEMRSKRHRKRPEIFQMQEHLQKNLGNSFTTRALAWAAGEISTQEFVTDVRHQADPDAIYHEFDLGSE